MNNEIEDFEDELRSSRKTFMIISHDRSLLNNIVDRIIHIQQGKLRSFSGTYEAYLDFLIEDQKRREKELDKLSNSQRRETAWIRRGAKARRTKSKKRIEDQIKKEENMRKREEERRNVENEKQKKWEEHMLQKLDIHPFISEIDLCDDLIRYCQKNMKRTGDEITGG